MKALIIETPPAIKESLTEGAIVCFPLALPPDSKIVAPKQIVARNTFKAKTIADKRDVLKTTVARSKKPKQAPDDVLTNEEKFAYNQLMLALSITGSKLRLVTDKIENSEEIK